MAPDATPFDTSDTTCQARENIPQSPSHYSWHHFKETYHSTWKMSSRFKTLIYCEIPGSLPCTEWASPALLD